MKISYRTHPALKYLKEGLPRHIPIHDKDYEMFIQNSEYIKEQWTKRMIEYKKETNVISNAFIDASEKAGSKLFDLYKDIVFNDLGDLKVSGTYILRGHVCFLHYVALKGCKEMELGFFLFNKQGVPLMMNVHDNGNFVVWVSNVYNLGNDESKITEFTSATVANMVILDMFKKYAQVETKILPPNKRVKDINCKYVNDTSLELTYLDSKWFTNLVKSDAFKVRGHFRLQPKKKDGEWTKELIWISDFIKTGYTAPAKILNRSQ